MLIATLVGSLPPALIYALTGATAARLDNVALVFGLVLLVAGLFWVVGRALGSHAERRKSGEQIDPGPGAAVESGKGGGV